MMLLGNPIHPFGILCVCLDVYEDLASETFPA